MPRQRKPKKSQNHERWLITYSDLITLLLVFFIILYAMSSVDKVKFETLAQSLSSALHQSQQIPLQGLGKSSILLSGDKDTGDTSPSPVNTPANTQPQVQNQQNQQDQAQLNSLYNLVNGYIHKNHLENQVSIANQDRGVQITMRDIALFDTGQAVLQSQAQKFIGGFVPFFKTLPNNIVVEGYTDNRPISTSIYPSNWELSSARAMSVVRFLSQDGLDANRLSGTGYGEYHNVKPNDNEADRQLNRRVNIVVLRQNLQPGSATAQPATHPTK